MRPDFSLSLSPGVVFLFSLSFSLSSPQAHLCGELIQITRIHPPQRQSINAFTHSLTLRCAILLVGFWFSALSKRAGESRSCCNPPFCLLVPPPLVQSSILFSALLLNQCDSKSTLTKSVHFAKEKIIKTGQELMKNRDRVGARPSNKEPQCADGRSGLARVCHCRRQRGPAPLKSPWGGENCPTQG